jgi:non-ribosomal peptide synthetase component E (peptide arylation enzyme)
VSEQLSGAVPIPAELRVRYAEAGLWDDAPLRDGLEAAAQRAPGRVAIADREMSWTYADLERSVASGVACLQREGVLAGAAVLVVAPLIARNMALALGLTETDVAFLATPLASITGSSRCT